MLGFWQKALPLPAVLAALQCGVSHAGRGTLLADELVNRAAGVMWACVLADATAEQAVVASGLPAALMAHLTPATTTTPASFCVVTLAAAGLMRKGRCTVFRATHWLFS